jgi:hypothetical protein
MAPVAVWALVIEAVAIAMAKVAALKINGADFMIGSFCGLLCLYCIGLMLMHVRYERQGILVVKFSRSLRTPAKARDYELDKRLRTLVVAALALALARAPRVRHLLELDWWGVVNVPGKGQPEAWQIHVAICCFTF